MNMKKNILLATLCLTAGIAQAQVNGLSFQSTNGSYWNAGTVEMTDKTSQTAMQVNTGQATTQDIGTFRGWGTCFSELHVDALQRLSQADHAEAIRRIFSPQGDLRFTVGRFSIGANDFARSWYSLDETPDNAPDFNLDYFNIDRDKACLIPFIKEALAEQPDIYFWASPWSPPQWMKTNKHYAQRRDGNNGCPTDVPPYNNDQFIMEDDYLNAYCRYFGKAIEAFKEEGINIRALSYQNEAYSNTPYPGCSWTAASTGRFLADYLGPYLNTNYPGVDMLSGTMNTDRTDVYNTILSTPNIGEYLKCLCFQWEGGRVLKQIHQQYPQYALMQSESECGSGTFDWPAGEHTFDLINHYVGNGCMMYTYWNTALLDGGYSTWGWKQNALIQVPSTGKPNYTPDYYAMMHYSHLITPDSRILCADEANKLLAARLTNGAVVVVAGNMSDNEKNITIGIDEKQATLHLPAHSFTTYYFATAQQKKELLLAEAENTDRSKWLEGRKQTYNAALQALTDATTDEAIEAALSALAEAIATPPSEAIPSAYYAAPAAGEFYLYSVDQKKFVKQSESNLTAMTDTPEETVKLIPNDEGTAFKIQMSHGKYAKLGSYNGRFFWTDDASGKSYWTIEPQADDTYLIYTSSTGYSELGDNTNYYINSTQTNYLNAWKSTANEKNAFALITESQYDAYRAAHTESLDSTSWITNFTQRDNTTSAEVRWENKTDDGAKYTIFDGKVFPSGTKLCKKYYGIPNGLYTITLGAGHWTVGKHAEVYATDGSTTVTKPITLTGNNYETLTLDMPIANQYVEVGVRVTDDNPDGSICIRDITLRPASETRSTVTGKLGTICLPYDANAEGAEVYTATISNDRSAVKLSPIAGPMQEGIPYIYRATADSQTFSYQPGGNIVKTPANTGCLKGTFEDSVVPALDYILQTQDGVQGFYIVQNQVHDIKAYRCYLHVADNTEGQFVNAFRIIFDDETALRPIAILQPQASLSRYSLLGTRLTSPTKGINIVNGKKVLVN